MSNLFYNKGFIVAPKSLVDINKMALNTRKIFSDCINNTGEFNIVKCLEKYFNYDIIDDDVMPNAYAYTKDKVITLSLSTYEGACNNIPRDRFTISHEVGHVILHSDQMHLARNASHEDKVYCNSEWQANEFAGSLLLPFSIIKAHNPAFYELEEMSLKYGVSKEAIQLRIDKLAKRPYLAELT